jgi:hypothetical protein
MPRELRGLRAAGKLRDTGLKIKKTYGNIGGCIVNDTIVDPFMQ